MLITLPSSLRDERLRRRGVGHQPGARDVELDHGAKALRRDRLGWAQELPAGVVDEHVEAAVALEHAVEELVDRLVVADVHRLGLGAAGERFCLGDHLGQRLGAAPASDHGRPEPNELERRSPYRARYRRQRRHRPGPQVARAQRFASAQCVIGARLYTATLAQR